MSRSLQTYAQQELSDFLNTGYPGLGMLNTFQHGDDWARSLDVLEGPRRLSTDHILSDFESFYVRSLPQRGALTPRQAREAREAFRHDAERIRCG